MHPSASTLLASIDHTLATVRAALTAGADPGQTEAARTELAGRAGTEIAQLVVVSRRDDWGGVPPEARQAIERAGAAAAEGDLAGAEQSLTVARERMGGASR